MPDGSGGQRTRAPRPDGRMSAGMIWPLADELVEELRGHLATWRSDESPLSAAELVELRFGVDLLRRPLRLQGTKPARVALGYALRSLGHRFEA